MWSDVLVFEPELSTGDMVSFLALSGVTVFALIAGIFILRAARRKSFAAFANSALVLGIVLACLVAIFVSRRAELNSVVFRDDWMIVIGPGTSQTFPLDKGNRMRSSESQVDLISGNRSVSLPKTAWWRTGNLVVNAGYLGNEFIGRSASFDAGKINGPVDLNSPFAKH